MKCHICSRQAKGYGYFNPKLKRSDPLRYSRLWVFCSRRCQEAFSKAMKKLNDCSEAGVIDPSEMETESMHSALVPLGEFVGSIGMDRPFSQYSKAEVLRLIEVVIDAYQGSMLTKHEEQAERERIYFERLAERQARQ